MLRRASAAVLLGIHCGILHAAGGPGMTWGNATNATTGDGVVFVSCHGLPRTQAGGCNACTGDIACGTGLLLLCLEVDAPPRPSGLLTPDTRAAMPAAFYAGGAAGAVAATAPVARSRFSRRAEADACGPVAVTRSVPAGAWAGFTTASSRARTARNPATAAGPGTRTGISRRTRATGSRTSTSRPTAGIRRANAISTRRACGDPPSTAGSGGAHRRRLNARGAAARQAHRADTDTPVERTGSETSGR
jgi:hypothetical protein